MSLTIKPVTRADIAACAELFTLTFSLPPWNEPWDIESAQFRIEHFVNSPDFIGFAACIDTEIVGFLVGRLQPWIRKMNFQIEEFCVNPNVQNQGVGTALLEHLYNHLIERNVYQVALSTYCNTPAFEFYNKRGYCLNPDLVFMQKSLVDGDQVTIRKVLQKTLPCKSCMFNFLGRGSSGSCRYKRKKSV